MLCEYPPSHVAQWQEATDAEILDSMLFVSQEHPRLTLSFETGTIAISGYRPGKADDAFEHASRKMVRTGDVSEVMRDPQSAIRLPHSAFLRVQWQNPISHLEGLLSNASAHGDGCSPHLIRGVVSYLRGMSDHHAPPTSITPLEDGILVVEWTVNDRTELTLEFYEDHRLKKVYRPHGKPMTTENHTWE